MASTWMTVEMALAVALELLDEDAGGDRATAYVTGDGLYVGPRKMGAHPTA